MLNWHEANDSAPPLTFRATLDGFTGSAHELSNFVCWLFRFGRPSKRPGNPS